jgi:hypothetical protein
VDAPSTPREAGKRGEVGVLWGSGGRGDALAQAGGRGRSAASQPGDWLRGVRCRSLSGGVRGYRSGSVGGALGRRHRGGQRAGHVGQVRRRQDRRLSSPRRARRPRLASARAPRVRPAGALRRDGGRRGVRRARRARSGPDQRRERLHWVVRARLAVVLERRERCEVWGEPRLRAAERQEGRPLASAQRGTLPDGRPRLRRPDLVLFPPDTALPIAVEVELSVKAAGRLAAICRAWARCRLVSEVRYYPRPMSRVRFPAPFPPSTPRRPSAFSRSMKPGRRPPMTGSPLDPVVHLLTSLALTIGAAVLATLSIVTFCAGPVCTGLGRSRASCSGRRSGLRPRSGRVRRRHGAVRDSDPGALAPRRPAPQRRPRAERARPTGVRRHPRPPGAPRCRGRAVDHLRRLAVGRDAAARCRTPVRTAPGGARSCCALRPRRSGSGGSALMFLPVGVAAQIERRDRSVRGAGLIRCCA